MRLRVLSLFTTAVAVTAVTVAPAAATPTGRAAGPAAVTTIPDSSAIGTYYRDAPSRILDTRSGARLGPGATVLATPAVTGVPNPSAVVVNLTVVNPTTSGYLTAYPTGRALPRTSSINFIGGQTIANLVTVPVGSDGKFAIYNGLGTVDVVVDQLGVYSADDAPLATRGRGGGYHPVDPIRLLDTRSDGGGRVFPGFYITTAVRDNSGAGISALAVNITVTNTGSNGYLTAWDALDNRPPKVSTLNFTGRSTVANSAVVPTSPCTDAPCGSNAFKIGVANGSGAPVDIVIDIVGIFDAGVTAAPVRYQPLDTPVRIVDSRSNTGMAKLGPGATGAFAPPSTVAGSTTVGVDANVTLVRPTASTYLTLWPQFPGVARPVVSTVNSPVGQVISNHAIQELGANNLVNVFNYNGTSDVVVDVSGTFENIATAAGKSAPRRDTVSVVTPGAARAVTHGS